MGITAESVNQRILEKRKLLGILDAYDIRRWNRNEREFQKRNGWAKTRLEIGEPLDSDWENDTFH